MLLRDVSTQWIGNGLEKGQLIRLVTILRQCAMLLASNVTSACENCQVTFQCKFNEENYETRLQCWCGTVCWHSNSIWKTIHHPKTSDGLAKILRAETVYRHQVIYIKRVSRRIAEFFYVLCAGRLHEIILSRARTFTQDGRRRISESGK